jgi:hypothetical protein
MTRNYVLEDKKNLDSQLQASQTLLAPQTHEQGLFEKPTGPGSQKSAHSLAPESPMPLPDMPFGPNSPSVAADASEVLAGPTYTGNQDHQSDQQISTFDKGRAVDSVSESSPQLLSQEIESCVPESDKSAEEVVVAKAESRPFLEGIEEAAASVMPSTDSGPNTLRNSMSSGSAEEGSADSPWAASLLEQHLAQPPTPDEQADITPLSNTVAPEESDAESELSELPPHLSPPFDPVPDRAAHTNTHQEAALTGTTNALFTPHSQAAALGTSPTSTVLFEPKNLVPRKRAAVSTKAADEKGAAALSDQDELSESDEGSPAKKRQKGSTTTEVSTKQQATQSSEQISSEPKVEVDRTGVELAQHMVSGTPPQADLCVYIVRFHFII